MFKMKKARWSLKGILWITMGIAALMTVMIGLPGMLVKKTADHKAPISAVNTISTTKDGVSSILIPVYLSKQKQIETVPLEAYVRGVLAAEMPVEFELEALKAQAMAARTYIVRRILDQDFSNVPVKDAWVTDTVAQQAYISQEELKDKWDADSYSANMDKINRAVKETEDLILTYENRPINATFFSTSNGYTENSEDYWPDTIPYLRSVASPWDVKLSPKYQSTVTLSYKSVLQKLGVASISTISTRSNGMKVLEWSAGHRIKRISIGGTAFTGRDVREKLGLASSQFEWKWKGTQLEFTTYGYGHGVGLSQWGANGMAKEGKTAEQIVHYYYTGISIDKAGAFLSNK